MNAEVVAVSRSRGQAEETVRAIVAGGGEGYAIPADVSRRDEVESLEVEVKRRVGTVVILVNAACVFGPIQLIKDSDSKRWMDTLAVNLFGPYLICRAFLGGMVDQGFGRIISFTSAASLHPPGPLNSAYATSKSHSTISRATWRPSSREPG